MRRKNAAGVAAAFRATSFTRRFTRSRSIEMPDEVKEMNKAKAWSYEAPGPHEAPGPIEARLWHRNHVGLGISDKQCFGTSE